MLNQLRHEGGGILEAVWKALPPLSPAAQETVAAEQAYFAFHQDRLHYPRYRAAGFPIGSGIIESACKTVLKQRESGSGMRWTKAGAQAISTFRAVASLLAAGFLGSIVPRSRRIAARSQL